MLLVTKYFWENHSKIYFWFVQTGPIRLFTPYKRIRTKKNSSSNSKKKKLDDGTAISNDEESCDSSAGVSLDNCDIDAKEEEPILIQTGDISQADIVQSNDSIEDMFKKLENVSFFVLFDYLTIYVMYL